VPNIFSTKENLSSVPPVVGVEIIKVARKSPDGRISLFDLFHRLKDKDWFAPRAVYFGMLFLYSTGLIEFDGIYVTVLSDDQAE